MTKLPAIALIELSSIAAGTYAADEMVKRSPVELLHAGTVQPGKYLILIGGGTAEVEESYREGMQAAPAEILDEVFLPQVHPRVVEALDGDRAFEGLRIDGRAGNIDDRRDRAGDRCRGERRAWSKSPNCGWATASADAAWRS